MIFQWHLESYAYYGWHSISEIKVESWNHPKRKTGSVAVHNFGYVNLQHVIKQNHSVGTCQTFDFHYIIPVSHINNASMIEAPWIL